MSDLKEDEFLDATDTLENEAASAQDNGANVNDEDVSSSPSKKTKKKNKKKKKNGKNAAVSTDDLSTTGADSEVGDQETENVDPEEPVAEAPPQGEQVEGSEETADMPATAESAEEESAETEPVAKESAETEPANQESAKEAEAEPAEQEAEDHTNDPLGESTQQFEVSEHDLENSNKSLEEKLDMLKMYEDDEDEGEAQDNAEEAPAPAVAAAGPPLPSRTEPTPSLPPRGEVPAIPSRHVPSLPPRVAAVAPTPPPRSGPSSPETERHILNQSELSKVAAEFQPPPLPPQLSERQKQNHRGSIFQSWFSTSSRASTSESVDEKEVTYDENYDLLLSRLNENTVDLSSKDDISKEQINSTHDILKSSFAATVSNISADESETQIDWSFWTDVVNDYSSVAKSDPSRLSKELSNGIPPAIRGIVWQLVSNANPKEFEAQYETLSQQETPFEKNIQKDLSRTSFVDDAGVDKDSLYRVIKAYSNIDTEVGYTQGMAFIAVPLLMNMSELEAFTVLHKLMYHYNLRSLFLPEMPGLLVKMYQFDRLLEDLLPTLSTHLQRQGVRSSMYASQWFLTFFAYKFPLEIVLRIYDIVITEGIESILKFAVALMQKNVDTLVTLKFDELLEFLKNQLFHAYLKAPVKSEEEETETTATSITAELYQVDQLVKDATEVKILPMTLHRYEEEFTEIHREEKERREEVDELKFRNNQMKREIRKVEASYTILNREHVQIANEMISGRMKLAELEDENNDLKKQNNVLRDRIKSLQNPESDDAPLPASLEEDLKNTMERNLEVMNKNQELDDQVQNLLKEIEDLKTQLEEEKAKNTTPVETATPHVKPLSGGLWGKKLFK